MATGVLVGTYLVFHTHASPATCPASREVLGRDVRFVTGHRLPLWLQVRQLSSAREMGTERGWGD